VLLALALVASACGSDGGGSGAGSSGGTGSVGILVTDSPSDEFCGIPIRLTGVSLLSDAGHVTIFDGDEIVDLLRLRDNSRLISVGRDVPARTYSKVRLEVEAIALERCDETGAVIETIDVQQSSPKIDLNPRGGIVVAPGDLVLIQLDVDAEKCIHAHGTGSGKYKFRPVVFVDVFAGSIPGRLVQLSGKIFELDSDAMSFQLCDTHWVSRPVGALDDERDGCVEILVTPDTSIFLADAVPGAFADLRNEYAATVLGRFVRNGEQLRVKAEVVQQDPDTLETLRGVVASAVSGDEFDLELDPDQGVDAESVVVVLQDGTKIFTPDGEELDEDDIQPDERAKVTGAVEIADPDTLVHSTVIFLRLELEELERISGVVSSWDAPTRTLWIEEDDGSNRCAEVPEDAEVFLAAREGDHIGFEPVDPSELAPGTDVTAFGTSGDPCLAARTVIGFEGFRAP
jgi:hypothetical protein